MPALGFHPQFIEPIRSGIKTHTIRARLATGFRVGDWAPLYKGLRTKHVELIGSGLMNRAYALRLDFDEGRVETQTGLAVTTIDELDAFAIADGFPKGWRSMEAFWGQRHPGVRQFSGVLMGWGSFTLEHRLGKGAAHEDRGSKPL